MANLLKKYPGHFGQKTVIKVAYIFAIPGMYEPVPEQANYNYNNYQKYSLCILAL